MPLYSVNTCYIIIIKKYFDDRQTALVSTLKKLTFLIEFFGHKLNFTVVSRKKHNKTGEKLQKIRPEHAFIGRNLKYANS